MALNPNVVQGTLNRVRTSVIIPAYPGLSVTAPYMGKSQCQLNFEGSFVTQKETATGFVDSPEPYVPATLEISLLRPQSLSNAWLQQVVSNAVLGDVVSHTDTSAFPAVHLSNCSIIKCDPGRFDGNDEIVAVTVRGVFQTNNILWRLV
jgi:hypothetical protein